MVGWLLALSLQAAISQTVPHSVTAPDVEATPVADVQVTARRRGRVTLDCEVLSSGGVRDCVIRSERPAGLGFGQAALEAASKAQMSPGSMRDWEEGRRIRFTTRFEVGP